MIKLIIFDLDGVLVDAKNIHYESLNESLPTEFRINWEEHISKYDGLKTNQKLDMLSKSKGLDKDLHKDIWQKKQTITLHKLRNLHNSEELIECISKLSNDGFKIACCSNSIRKTVITVLSKLGIIEFFDLILSNEDVNNSKPHPEIYWKAMSTMNILPEETLIVEDSPTGLLSAFRSNSFVLRVTSPSQVTYDKIKNKLNEIKYNMKTPKWSDKSLNVLIPMAGAGSRFEKAGYSFPKPLIDVNGEPMIKLVTENLNVDANFIYIVQKKHREAYNLDTLLNLISPNCSIIEVDGITEGAACTTLLAKHLINNENPLIMANSDQFVEWDSNEFMYKMNESNCDGGIVTFKSTHPKWSFAKVDENGFITEVAEKNPISDIATVGIYYWKKGSDYVKYAEKMIEKNIRVNNEFYVCPVFNQSIEDNKKIIPFQISKMYGLGTPEDLTYFINNYNYGH
jgi:HAD superfamily hydrolase (TIGR01509 family)